MDSFDVVVIGAGPGGYPAAIRAAQLGASVAIVEKEALGGTCLNWGCIPTKTLIASSDLYAQIAHAGTFGIKVKGMEADYPAMIRRKDEVVGKLKGGIGQLLKANKVTVFEGAASFESRTRLTVTSKTGSTSIGFKSAIIATGSVSVMPGFIPRHERIVESRRLLEINELPASMTILGGGVIGCEFACLAAQLGVKVTLVEMLEDVLMILDRDVRSAFRNHLEKTLGVTVLTGAPLTDIKAGAKSVSGKVGEKTVESEMLLVAIGRKAFTEGLGLEKAGLKVNERGILDVDDNCRTAAPNIFAIGDVNGRAQLAHAATSQGVTAAENALGKKPHPMEALVPACIFTSPEIGAVGMSEADAAKKGFEVVTGKFHLAGLGKALASGHTEGFVKWVARKDTGQLIGGHAIGAHATELIAEAGLAIRAELTLDEVANTVHSHPTLSEAWMEAAHAAHGTCIHAPPKRR